MTTLTSNGLILSRLADRVTELNTAVQTIFGADISIDPNTTDGQHLGVFAESINNLDMLLGQIYTMLDPDSASGTVLRRLVKLNGITWQPGSYSTVLLNFGGVYGTLIGAGTLVHSTITNTVFSTDADATIPLSGAVTVSATAQAIGAQAAPAGSVTAFDTPIFNVQTVTNPADALVGREDETDGQLRARRNKSVAGPGQTIREAVYSGVANVLGVSHVQVYENDQPAADPTTGQAKNSFYVVVQGGANQDIAQAILLRKTGGIPTLGAITVQAVDSQGTSHPIQFDRPTAVPVYVVVNGAKRPGFPVDGNAQIAAAILAYGQATYDIGDDVTQSDMYDAMSPVGFKTITSVYIGTAPGPTTGAPIAVAYNALVDFELAHITVNIV